MHLSSVDLPEPLCPRMPTVSPCVDLAADVVQRLELDVAAPVEAQDPLLERVDRVGGDAERLRHRLDAMTATVHSQRLRQVDVGRSKTRRAT